MVFHFNCYFEIGDYQQAIEDYSQAIDLDSEPAYYYSWRGNCYFEIGDYQQAIEDLQKAATLYLKEGRIVSYQEMLDKFRDIQS